MAIPLTLIGGYLGSGKTTLINRLLSSPQAGRTAVVVNDFGDVNIDAALIAATGADTMELTNGCICCQITDDVQRTMSALAAREDIDRVVCEVSGIGDPSQLGTWRTFPGFRPGPVVVCADALVTPRRLGDEYVSDVVHRQIASADVVLVTKTDVATAAQVEATRRACARIAPNAQIHSITSGDPTSLLAVLSPWSGGDGSEPGGGDSHGGGDGRGGPDERAAAAPYCDDAAPRHTDVHRTVTVGLPPGVDLGGVVALLERTGDLLVRAKGFARDADGVWQQIHLAGDVVSVAPLPVGTAAPARAEIVLIAAGAQAHEALTRVEAGLHALAPAGHPTIITSS